MGRLVYSMNVSLDGYVEAPDHGLDWTVADDELHHWFADQARSYGASLYGRRLYELMRAAWPAAGEEPGATSGMREFGRIWAAMPKIVFSRSLERVGPNDRLVRGEPAEELARIRAETDADLEVGGATLAAAFVRLGLVDELRPVIHPVVLGAGTPYLPALDRPLGLRLLETHQLASGAVALRYEVDRGAAAQE